jgi:hypothetical protein
MSLPSGLIPEHWPRRVRFGLIRSRSDLPALPPPMLCPQRGVVCGDGLATLSLEPFAVRRVPRRRPRCPSAPRRRADLAVGSRTTSTSVRDLRAAGEAGLHPTRGSGAGVFSSWVPRIFRTIPSRDVAKIEQTSEAAGMEPA